MNITISIPDTPECKPDDGEVLCEISHGVQGVLTLMTVDMSFQVCFEGGCLPPLPILNSYLKSGSSDLLADRLDGHDLYFKAVMRDGTEIALSGPSLYDADITHYQHLYNPLGGSLSWDGFELSEDEFEVLIEVLQNSGFEMQVDDFGVLKADDDEAEAEDSASHTNASHTDAIYAEVSHTDDSHTDAVSKDAGLQARNSEQTAHAPDFSAWFFAALDHARRQ